MKKKVLSQWVFDTKGRDTNADQKVILSNQLYAVSFGTSPTICPVDSMIPSKMHAHVIKSLLTVPGSLPLLFLIKSKFNLKTSSKIQLTN